MRNLWMGMRGLFYGGQERGQTMAEYALIIAFVALIVIAAVTFLGEDIAGFYNTFTAALPS